MNALVSFRLCKLSDKELLHKVDAMTDKMYQDQKIPARYIPARPDEDYDLLVGELVKRYYGKIDESPSHATDLSKVFDENADINSFFVTNPDKAMSKPRFISTVQKYCAGKTESEELKKVKYLLNRKIQALRVEVHESIANDIQSTIDTLFSLI